jgi:hypothetical protein
MIYGVLCMTLCLQLTFFFFYFQVQRLESALELKDALAHAHFQHLATPVLGLEFS